MRRSGLTLLELLVVLTILVSLATIVVPMIGMFGRQSQQVSTRENLLRLQELLVNQYRADMGELPRPSPTTVAAGTRQDHPQLRYLFVNPDSEDISVNAGTSLLSGRVWRGPYLMHRGARYLLDNTNNFTSLYGIGDVLDTSGNGNITTPGDPTVLDAWGRPIVIQVPNTGAADDMTYARLVSAGPDGKINTPEIPASGATAQLVRMPDRATRGDDLLMFLFRDDQYGDGVPKLEP